MIDPATLSKTAPEQLRVTLETTKGNVVLELNRAWSPFGADRFYSLVCAGYYDGAAFHRVLAGFMCQVGISADPEQTAAWGAHPITDDPPYPGVGNTRGMLSFAKKSAPNARTAQFFISFGDNSNLDAMGFTPFARAIDMDVVDRLHAGYGECGPSGQGPDQGRSKAEGSAYWRAQFPELDYITRATVM